MILNILGKSCAGKDVTARILEKEHGFDFVVSTTSRPIRDGESERNPYNFVSNSTFEELIKNDGLIEYREYNTLVNNIPAVWYYGVENKEVDSNKDTVVVLDTVGLEGFTERFGDKVKSFYLDIDLETRKQRCVIRGDYNENEFNRRAEDDEIRFSKEVIQNKVDYVITSTDRYKIVEEILNKI